VESSPRALESQLEDLWARYAGLVYRISRRYARDESDVDDIAQEVWKRVILLLPRKRPGAPTDRWVSRVAVNVAKESRKHGFRFDRFRNRMLGLLGIERGKDPEHERLSERLKREVAEHVWSLPTLQKEVVLRRIYEGLSLAETAAELDVAVGTVKASFHRANRKLARKLEPLRELWERGEI
jgi:RNA polymerase sigma-70 factor (ECF subfamily)